MKGNFYKMYPEHQFAVVKLQTEYLYPEDLEALNEKYKNDPDYSKIHYLVIVIDEKSKPKFKLNYLSRISQKYNVEPQENNHKNIVWVVSRPIITALTHLFVLKLKDNSHYCSTVQKAYHLLESPMDYNTFNELIESAQDVCCNCR